eukprot:jgi/Botrbrau1/20249/Bobra.31_1s0038.1
MASAKKSVDEIWREINQRPSTMKGKSCHLGDGLRVERCVVIRPGGLSDPDYSGLGNVKPNLQPTSTQQLDDNASSYLATIQLQINCLYNSDRYKRISALEILCGKLLPGPANAKPPSQDVLQALINGPLLVPLLQLLSDPVEKCRERVTYIISQLLPTLPGPLVILPQLLTALLQRLGSLPPLEQSEEVRLALVRLYTSLLQREAVTELRDHGTEFAKLIRHALLDPYHEIKKAGCVALVSWLRCAHRTTVSSATETLVDALLEGCTHSHSQIRLTSVEALTSLVSQGLAGTGLLERIGAAMQGLMTDRHTAVRKAVVKAVSAWLCHLTEQDGISNFLPTLLLSHTDEDASVQVLGMSCLEKVAAAANLQEGPEGLAVGEGNGRSFTRRSCGNHHVE